MKKYILPFLTFPLYQCSNIKKSFVENKSDNLKVDPSDFEEEQGGIKIFNIEKFTQVLDDQDSVSLKNTDIESFWDYAITNGNEKLLKILLLNKYFPTKEWVKNKIIYFISSDIAPEQKAKLLSQLRYLYFEDLSIPNCLNYLFPQILKEQTAVEILQYCVKNSINIRDLLDWSKENIKLELFNQIKDDLRTRGIPLYLKNEEGKFSLEIKKVGDIPTFVLATDKRYALQTKVVIKSIIESTPGLKRFIILKTSDFDENILTIPSQEDVRIFIWDANLLQSRAFEKYPGLEDEWKLFSKNIPSQHNNLGITIRTLFPVLFNRCVLPEEYLSDVFNLKCASGEEFINNFIWLDGDLIVQKDLNELYRQFSMVKFNSSIIAQPCISALLSWGEFLNYFNFNNIFVANTPSGGVVGWNLMAFRNKSFNFVDFFKTFNLINEYYNTNKHSYGTEEFFIQNLLGLWSFAENKNLYSVESCKSIYNSQFSRCKPLDLYGEIYILSSNFNFFPCYSQPNKNFNFFPCYFQPDKNNCHILHWDNCTKPWTKIKIFLNFDFLVQRAACFYSLKKEFSKNDLQDIDGKLYEIKDLYKKYNQLIRENVLKSEFKTVDDNILQQIESKMAEIGFTENSFDKNIFLKKLYMHCRDNNIGELNIFRKILKSLDSNWRFCQYIEFSTYTKADFVWFSKASQNLSEEEFFSLFG